MAGDLAGQSGLEKAVQDRGLSCRKAQRQRKKVGGRGSGQRREAASRWRGASFQPEPWALVRLLCAALRGARGAELDRVLPCVGSHLFLWTISPNRLACRRGSGCLG